MSHPHSTLELFKHDATARAPEYDYTAERRTYEKPHPYLGSEKFFDERPTKLATVATDSTFPDSEKLSEPVALNTRSSSTGRDGKIMGISHRLSRRTLIIIALVIIAVVIGVAIGTGIGVGLRTRTNTNRGSPTMSTGTTTGAASPTITSSPSLATPNMVMSDTSLAAVELPDGDRFLYFQDNNGMIRQAAFSFSTQKWTADQGFIVASDAKNHTPIAAITTPQKGDTLIDGLPVIPAGVAIFYITENNSLASLQLAQGTWNSPTHLGDFFTNISHYSAAPESRHLAVSSEGNGSQFNAVLFYESVDSGITMLNGTFYNQSYTTAEPLTIPTWTWANITDNLLASRTNKSDLFAPPFTTSHTAFGEALFLAKDQHGNPTGNQIGSHFDSISVETSSSILPENAIQDSFQNSDLLILDQNLSPGLEGLNYFSSYYFWINGTAISPTMLPITTMPKVPFPFKRLAGFSPAMGKKFVLYHQLNGTALGEELYDASVGGWVSNEIAVTA